jgi:hypothetical protein
MLTLTDRHSAICDRHDPTLTGTLSTAAEAAEYSANRSFALAIAGCWPAGAITIERLPAVSSLRVAQCQLSVTNSGSKQHLSRQRSLNGRQVVQEVWPDRLPEVVENAVHCQVRPSTYDGRRFDSSRGEFESVEHGVGEAYAVDRDDPKTIITGMLRSYRGYEMEVLVCPGEADKSGVRICVMVPGTTQRYGFAVPTIAIRVLGLRCSRSPRSSDMKVTATRSVPSLRTVNRSSTTFSRASHRLTFKEAF